MPDSHTTVYSPVTSPLARNLSGNSSAFSDSCIVTSSSYGAGDLISPEAEFLITKLKSAVIIPLLYLFGGPTNLLNMIVFFKQGLGDRVNLCLFSLAIVDFTSVSFYFLIFVEHIFMFNSPETFGEVYAFLMSNKVMLFYNMGYGSMLLSVIIALERCICVLLPLRAKLLLKTKTMAAIIITTVPTVSFLRLAVLAKYVMLCIYDKRRQLALKGPYVTEYAVRNKEFLEGLDGIFYGFIMGLGCPIIVLIATIITIGKLWHTAAWRKQTSSANTRKEMAVTKMLVLLSFMFLVFDLPRIWVRTYPLFDPEFSTKGQHR
ncbi:uncharacterized protein LOC112562477 [Pomacea canaliculata]|uniref:uncharacterized protein LOC112562477 n=1 Tax=Pomacea canaliculata TaxID=400727 RepID=UPI000D73311D|nr:uncharacterized protein LOC112562477 [Pomacea canaliculata]